MPDDWDRRKGERSNEYHAFTIYRDLGPQRTLRRVSHELDRPLPTIEHWSKKNDWVARAEEWDSEQDRTRRAIYQHVVKEMGERHARIALLMLEKAIVRIKTMDADELSPSDLAKWVQIAVTIERQAFGEPGEIVQQTGAAQTQNIMNDVKIIQSNPDALREAVNRWESLVLGHSYRALESGEPGLHPESE